jgi:hypothetical protein
MSEFDNIIKLISSVTIDNPLELELKFILDKRIKKPYHIKNKIQVNVIDFYLYIYREFQPCIISKSQTINFIKSDKNYGMSVKQLHFNGDVQIKELKTYYIKKSLIPPIFIESGEQPLIKLSLCSEQIINSEQSISYDLVRFKDRFSIKLNELWRLDITLIKETSDINVINSIHNLKSIIKSLFCRVDNYKFSDKIEFEIEFIGNIKILNTNMIKEADALFNEYITKFRLTTDIDSFNTIKEDKIKKDKIKEDKIKKDKIKEDKIKKDKIKEDKIKEDGIINEVPIVSKPELNIIYTNNICLAARLLKPNLINKFQSGYFGMKQLGSNPIEIDKGMYYNNILPSISDYIITDKIDGTRSLVFIYINKCYVINNKNIHSISEILLNDQEIEYNKILFDIFKSECIILDAELIQSKSGGSDLYYVFDIIKYINIDVFNFNFDDRLNYINKLMGHYTFIKHKTFTYIQDLIENNISIKTFYIENCELTKQANNYSTDGIIIFNRNANYNETKYYKWKPICTIDFYLKKCPNNILGIEPYVNKPDKTLYILFSGINDIDYNNLNLAKDKYYYDILGRQKFNKKYFPIQFEPADNPWAYLFWHDSDNLDDKIVELTYANQWEFIKIRDDRKNDMARKTYYGNYFKYAESIWFNLQNKLDLDNMIYVNSDISLNNSYFKVLDNDDYSAIRKFNNFVKMKLIELNLNTLSMDNIIDICSGRGQDLQKYINCGFKNIFMFDNDIDGIIEIINRKYKYSKLKYNTSNYSKFPNIYAKKLNILDPPKDNISSIKKLIKIANVNKVKIIVCNFALHYLVYNKTKLSNFTRLLNDILDPGGIFIFTSFDGNKIFDLLLNTDKYEISVDSKIIYSIKKKYRTVEFTGLGNKIDVLLPFSNDEYYTEYLINIDLVKSAFHSKGINLMIESSFSEYVELFKEEKKYFYDKLNNADKEYISLYKFYIFQKNGKKK